jgi:hypothetical protein
MLLFNNDDVFPYNKGIITIFYTSEIDTNLQVSISP